MRWTRSLVGMMELAWANGGRYPFTLPYTPALCAECGLHNNCQQPPSRAALKEFHCGSASPAVPCLWS